MCGEWGRGYYQTGASSRASIVSSSIAPGYALHHAPYLNFTSSSSRRPGLPGVLLDLQLKAPTKLSNSESEEWDEYVQYYLYTRTPDRKGRSYRPPGTTYRNVPCHNGIRTVKIWHPSLLLLAAELLCSRLLSHPLLQTHPPEFGASHYGCT
jgi:hypothetical protein